MKNGENAVSLTAKTDYYPFGMPMPNRNIEGNYRYKFQGQEKDAETGKEAFELRLWDGRIGRWLTVDPYGQYHSPYLGMGNNPVSRVDPDGGKDGRCTGCPGNAKQGDIFNHPEFGQLTYDDFSGWGNGATMLDTVELTGKGGSSVSAIDLFLKLPMLLLESMLKGLEGNSGSPVYGNGTDNQMSRKGDGEVYGTWDFNEMIIPGNNLPSSNGFLNNINEIVVALKHYDNLKPLISPPTSDDTETVQAIILHIHSNMDINGNVVKTVTDTTYIDVPVTTRHTKDSVRRANENIKNSTIYWLNN